MTAEIALRAVFSALYPSPSSNNSDKNANTTSTTGRKGLQFCLIQNTFHLVGYDVYWHLVDCLQEALMISAVRPWSPCVLMASPIRSLPAAADVDEVGEQSRCALTEAFFCPSVSKSVSESKAASFEDTKQLLASFGEWTDCLLGPPPACRLPFGFGWKVEMCSH